MYGQSIYEWPKWVISSDWISWTFFISFCKCFACSWYWLPLLFSFMMNLHGSACQFYIGRLEHQYVNACKEQFSANLNHHLKQNAFGFFRKKKKEVIPFYTWQFPFIDVWFSYFSSEVGKLTTMSLSCRCCYSAVEINGWTSSLWLWHPDFFLPNGLTLDFLRHILLWKWLIEVGQWISISVFLVFISCKIFNIPCIH